MDNLRVNFGMEYAGYLIGSLGKDAIQVYSIILFGSVSRGESNLNSDIDIFLEAVNSRIARKIDYLTKRFYETERYKKYWKLIGITNEIKVICGQLKDWPELRESIINDGILIYGKYIDTPSKGQPQVLIWWEAVKNQSKRVLLSKQLYGWKQNGKRYQGWVEKTGAKKINTNTILVDLKNAKIIEGIFKKHQIFFKQKIVSKTE